jgi:hypothetical protein
MTKQYTDEELSRILSAHEGGFLAKGGVTDYGCGVGCVNQFAYNKFGTGSIMEAFFSNDYGATVFDGDYKKFTDDELSPPENLLDLLLEATEQ